jgi:hypothetical protein
LAPPTAHPAAHPPIRGCAVCAVRRWARFHARFRKLHRSRDLPPGSCGPLYPLGPGAGVAGDQ